MKNMPKDQMERIIHKLYHKRNLNFRSFFINLVLILAVWLLTMTPGFDSLAGRMMHCGSDNAETYMLYMLGLWKVAGVVLFLVPALAAWWEMKAFEKN